MNKSFGLKYKLMIIILVNFNKNPKIKTWRAPKKI